MDNVFFDFTILLAITVSIAAVMRILRQPLMTAYIIAGIVAGPLFLNVINGREQSFEAFAQFGVVLLLFVVGLSLNVTHLKRVGKTASITGLIQVCVTGLVGFFLARYSGLSLLSSIYLGVAITFSSTIIISKLLGDKKDIQSTYGRNAFALMLVQDIIAIIIMLALASLQTGADLFYLAGQLVIKGILLIALVYFLSRYLLPKILDQVAKSGEFLFIFTVAWCFGVASILYWAGFSVEIGAIVAGLSLGSSRYQPQILSRVKPLRDFFIVLFFIILGSQMSLVGSAAVWLPATLLSLYVLLGNPLILYALYRLQKFSRRNSFLGAVTSAQVSEFGFVLIFTGSQLGHLRGAELSIFTIVALTTIFVSSYIITYNEQIYRALLPVFGWFGPDRHRQKGDLKERYDVIVFGYHRIGWKVCEALAAQKLSFLVIDFNPSAIAKLKARGISCYFGDAADVEFLESLPLEKAKLIISTLPEADDQMALIQFTRGLSKRPIIVANIYHSEHLAQLYHAGADFVMMSHLLVGEWMSGVLKNQPITKQTFKEYKKSQKKEMKLRLIQHE
jgi:Kef-type K+ transport system membrane component KefB